VQVAEFDRDALAAAAPTVAALARAEDLPAHGRAVQVRLGVRPGSAEGSTRSEHEEPSPPPSARNPAPTREAPP